MNREITFWEKIFAKHIFGEGWVSRIYIKNFCKLNNKMTNIPI